MVNRTVVVGLGLVLLAGCSSASEASDPSSSPSGSTGPTGATEGNGTLYTSLWDTSAGTRTITSPPDRRGRRDRGRGPGAVRTCR